MANTYTQLYIQFVFAVQNRKNLIEPNLRVELEKVITGIVTKVKCKLIAIYCNPDHTHLFVGMHPSMSSSKLMELVKTNSSKWLNNKVFFQHKFSWQEGYGAFSYSQSQIDSVAKYILNQEEHHKTYSFREEYLLFLKKFEVKYDSKYLFKWDD